MSLRVIIVGYGRMGQEIERLCKTYDCTVVSTLDIHNNLHGEGLEPKTIPKADVAIDFSTPDATIKNLPKLATVGINVVIGTTGWNEHEAKMKSVVADNNIGVVVASNFSLGVNIFQAITERAGELFKNFDDYGSWIHEAHHENKIDAPSGTAISLKNTMQQAGYNRKIDISSTRVGALPGIHTVGFDGPFETVTLTHSARDRATFARGALEAARWVKGRNGWFTMRDVLELEP